MQQHELRITIAHDPDESELIYCAYCACGGWIDTGNFYQPLAGYSFETAIRKGFGYHRDAFNHPTPEVRP